MTIPRFGLNCGRRHAAGIVLVALLAGCASPAPPPRGAPRTDEVAPRFASGGQSVDPGIREANALWDAVVRQLGG